MNFIVLRKIVCYQLIIITLPFRENVLTHERIPHRINYVFKKTVENVIISEKWGFY